MFRAGVFVVGVAGFIALLATVAIPLRLPGARPAPQSSVSQIKPQAFADVDGQPRTLFRSGSDAFDVVFIVATDCPISNRYAPEIARICSDYRDRGVQCSMGYVDRDVTPAQVKQHQSDFKLTSIPAIIDSHYAITDAAGARVTPEAAVFSNGRRVYHGRIDDLNPELGKTKREATRHDVRLALDQAIAGQPIAMPEAPAVGCFIERVK